MDLGVSAGLLGGSALLGGLSGMTAKRGRWSQQPTMTPQQQGRAEFAGQTGMQQIQNPYQGFQPIAQNVIGQYNRQVVPSLAERFSSMGSNALSSPAFGSELQGAGTDLQERLAAMQAQYGLQQQDLGQRLMGMGQSPQFENQYTAGGPSGFSNLFGGLSQGLGSLGMGGMNQYFNPSPLNQLTNKLKDPKFIDMLKNPEIMQILQNPQIMQLLKGLM